jgi:DNA modification methylase
VDPFVGTGTTVVAAIQAGRNSIGIDIESEYLSYARKRISKEAGNLFGSLSLDWEDHLCPQEKCPKTA